jgi:hypothetical protein
MVVGYAPASNTSACLWDSGAPYFTENTDGTQTLVSSGLHANGGTSN